VALVKFAPNRAQPAVPLFPSGDFFGLPPWLPGMRIGLLGGSFDPAHEGHRQVSLVGLRSLRLDQVWWLVSPQNPLKPNAPSQELVERIRAARGVASHPRIRVTGIEATLGTTYTANTLRKLLPRLAGAELVWMMGADNLAGFHRWRDWPAIAASVPIAVFNRPGSALTALAGPTATALANRRLPERAAASLAGMPPPAWVFLSKPYIQISSTELRHMRS
jgi:nicotinate-nucleotide adenylyltransferase